MASLSIRLGTSTVQWTGESRHGTRMAKWTAAIRLGTPTAQWTVENPHGTPMAKWTGGNRLGTRMAQWTAASRLGTLTVKWTAETPHGRRTASPTYRGINMANLPSRRRGTGSVIPSRLPPGIDPTCSRSPPLQPQ